MKVEIATHTRFARGLKPGVVRKEFVVLLTIDGRTLEMLCVGPDVARKQAVELAKSFGLDQSEIRCITP